MSVEAGASSNGRGWITSVYAVWIVSVLTAYVALRPDDILPVLSALSDRGLDIATPLILTLAYLPIGSALVRRFFDTDDALTHLLSAAGLGLGVSVAVTVVGGFAGVLGAGTIVACAVVFALLFAGEWYPLGARARIAARGVAEAVRTIPGATVLALLALALLTALSPAVSQDALHYHLEVPKRWLEAGGFVEVPGNVYSRFPMNMELLYLQALAVRGEVAAKVWHWIFAVLAAGSIGLLARRFCRCSTLAWWAPALFLAVPTVFRVSTWAYVEMPLVFYLTLGWTYVVVASEDRSQLRSATLAGVFLGLACGVKYTAAPVALAAAALLVIGRFGSSTCNVKERLRRTFYLGVGCAVSGSFWYLKNWIEVGNPVYPFLYSSFGGGGWDAARAELFAGSLREWGGELNWSLPFDLTFGATFFSIERFDGVVGPGLLLVLPLLLWLGVRRPETRSTLVFASFLITLWILTTRQVRFLVPTLALLNALVPVGIVAMGSRVGQVSLRLGLIAAMALSFVSHLILFGTEAPVAYAVGLESHEANRARRLPGGDALLFARIATYVAEDERVLFAASGNPVYLCPRPYHADSVVENHTLRQLLSAGDAGAIFAAFQAQEFSHLLFRFELVFGDPSQRSDLTVKEQQRLADFLNRYAKLVDQEGGTFLYRIVANGGRP
ncbi:MAG: phospholipid carrier-dependent glycosyltransferase [Planctomycetota bacterium]